MTVPMIVAWAVVAGGAKEGGADRGDDESAHHPQPAQHHIPGYRTGGRHQDSQDQDARRVRGGDRGRDGDGVPQPSFPSSEVGGHDGLAVAGHRRVHGAQHERHQQGQQPERHGQPIGADQRVEPIGQQAGVAGEDVHPGHARRRRGPATVARLRRHPGRAYVERRAEQVGGIVAQLARHAPGRDGGVAQPHALPLGGDLPPAHGVAPVGVGESQRHRPIDPQGRGEPAGEPAGTQPGGARPVGEGGAGDPPAQSPPTGIGPYRVPQIGAGPASMDVRRTGRRLLQGGNLGEVHDGEVLDPVPVDRQPVVVVDAEIPQGMRGERDGDGERHDHGVSASSSLARAAPPGEKCGLMDSALVRWVRAAASCPSACSSSPR